jgi:hypothetical protein
MMSDHDRSVDAFTASAQRENQRPRRVSDFEAWTERHWGTQSPTQRGIVTFSDRRREGTIMVTPAARGGTVRVDLQFAEPARGYTSLAAVVREGWMRDVAMAERGEWSCCRLVDALLEVAALPNQRTVRMERQRLSA